MIHHKEIIVGSSLPALIFAINKSIPIFYSDFDRPFYFDCISPKVNLDFLGLENTPKILKGINKQKTVGIKKEIIWERLLFLLSLSVILKSYLIVLQLKPRLKFYSYKILYSMLNCLKYV